MTRTYARQDRHFDLTWLKAAVKDGHAKTYETNKGTVYVVTTDEGTFAVRPHQINDNVEERAYYHDLDEEARKTPSESEDDVLAHFLGG